MSEEKGITPEDLLGVGTWVRQGPATLVVRENGWVVLVPGMRKQVTEAAWEVLGRKPAPEEFLDAFLEAGELESIDKLKALLFGFHDGTTGTFGVKGSTPIVVHTAEGAQLIAGTEEEPFVLKTLEGVRRTAFGDLPAEDAVGLPRVSAGIIPVRGFVHATVDPADLAEAERTALAEQVEEQGRSIEDPEAKKRRAAAPKPPPRPAGSSASAPLIKPATADRPTGSMPPSLSRGSGGRSTAPAAAEPESTGPNMFEGLFASAPPAAQAPPAAPPASPQPAAPAPATEQAQASAAAQTPGPAQSAEPTPAPAPAADPTPAAEPAPSAPGGVKRRLVSTSLFDRGRRSTPPATPAPQADAESAPTARTGTGAEPAADPATPQPASAATPAGADAPAPADTSAPAGTSAPADTPAPAPNAPATSEAPSAPPAMAPPVAATPAAAPTPAPRPAASVPTPEPAGEDEFDSPPTLVAPIDDGDEELSSPDTQVAPIDDEDQDQDQDQEPTPRPVRRAAGPTPSAGDLENTGAYDDLFGKTVFRRIEDAAVRRSEDEEGEEEDAPDAASSAPSAASAPSAPQPPPAPAHTGDASHESAPRSADPAPTPQPAEPSGGGEFIDWVPGVGRAAPEVAQTAARRAAEVQRPQPAYPQVQMPARPAAPQAPSRPAPAGYQGMQGTRGQPPRPAPTGYEGMQGTPGQPPRPAGYADAGAAGHQVGHRGPDGQPPSAPAPAAAQQARPPSSGPGMPASANGPGQVVGGGVTLTGLVCPNGHANSPEHTACRVCGVPLPREPRTVVRPPLGMVAITGGGRILLDRTAIIGRKPRASRVSGNEVPQLITVPSPQQDISRSHLELRLEGWHVVALDLGTTNGTTLYREGYEPVRLRPREGMVLRHGDRLDLGDGVHLMYGERA